MSDTLRTREPVVVNLNGNPTEMPLYQNGMGEVFCSLQLAFNGQEWVPAVSLASGVAEPWEEEQTADNASGEEQTPEEDEQRKNPDESGDESNGGGEGNVELPMATSDIADNEAEA